jgi:phosphonopyruvate decarboxylase
MRRDHALEILKQHVTDELVVAVYQTCFDWLAINPRDLNYVAVGAMGQASSHGLGLALASPERSVLVFDGDGSLLMNLGSLVTIGQAAPENLHHFVFVNGVYEVNGDHPIPGQGRVDFAEIARGAGYRDTATFTALDDFRDNIGNFLAQPGPVLAVMHIEPGEPYPRDYDFIHSQEARDMFRTALTAR